MKLNPGKKNIKKELAISAGIGVIIGILVLSYASNNNIIKLEGANVHPELSALANEILTTGDISSKGITNSLASKVLAANRAMDAGNAEGAVAALEGLISQVNDQSGNKVSADEAEVLVQLAQGAIDEMKVAQQSCNGVIMADGACCEPPNVVVEYGGVEYCVSS